MAKRLVLHDESPEAARMRARLSSFAALIRLGQEHNRDALARAREAEEAARAVGDPEALARALDGP